MSGLRTWLFTGPWRSRARWAVRVFTPWGLEWWLYQRSQRRARGSVSLPPPSQGRVEDAIQFLLDRGVEERTVRWGSIPGRSLEYLGEVVAPRLPTGRPLRVLHVGNFVGVSLCHLSWLARESHPDSVVVSIDPNTTHRGVRNPQSHVLALLDHFDLLANNLIISGYTLEQTSGEPGAEDEHDRSQGLACQNVLGSLGRLGLEGFDLALLDGNHSEEYLSREFDALREVLAPQSIVIFDDIDEWEGVIAVLRRALKQSSCASLGQDGRVGILEVRTPEPRPESARPERASVAPGSARAGSVSEGQ